MPLWKFTEALMSDFLCFGFTELDPAEILCGLHTEVQIKFKICHAGFSDSWYTSGAFGRKGGSGKLQKVKMV